MPAHDTPHADDRHQETEGTWMANEATAGGTAARIDSVYQCADHAIEGSVLTVIASS
jgi:hypothetical protein